MVNDLKGSGHCLFARWAQKYFGNGRDVKLGVPTGEYMLTVEASGFQTKRQLLKAYQPVVFRSVALPVAWIHGQTTSSLTGTVRNYDGDVRGLRVRLLGLYGTGLREAALDSRASFNFPADDSAYLFYSLLIWERRSPNRFSLSGSRCRSFPLTSKEDMVRQFC